MIFTETKLKGAFLIEPELMKDERGFFARSFCENEFKKHGLKLHIVQCNLSFNRLRGTVRGMHYQSALFEEAKLVSCTGGAVYDVIIDLRPESSTYCQSFGTELSAKNYRMLYIPEGFAHGFQTLNDNSVVFYQMCEFYHIEASQGVRWDDPVFDIKWPMSVQNISERDRGYPDFRK